MGRTAVAGPVSLLIGCTATTPLEHLGSNASNGTASVSSSASGAGGMGGSVSGGGEGGGGSTPCVYAAHVLADTPVAYWHLDEANTPYAYDATDYHNDGLYVDGVTVGVPGAFAQSGTAAQFAGDGSVDFGDRFDFAGTAAFSLEAWVRVSPGASGAIIGKLDYVAMQYSGYILFVSGTGTVGFHRRPGGVALTPSALPSSFAHIVATYDTVTMRVYVNGVEAINQPHADPIPRVASPFFIADATNWQNFDGVVDEVAIYDYALSSQQVAERHACANISSAP